MPRRRKTETCEYIKSNVDLKTFDEIAADLKITKQRVQQYCSQYGINKRIKTMTDAMAEIRRLRSMVPHETLT